MSRSLFLSGACLHPLLLAAFVLTGCVGPDDATYTYTLSGQVLYEDRIIGTEGFAGVSLKPVRHATVDLVSGGTLVESVSTDGDGYYSFGTNVTGGAEIRVLAKSETPSEVEVRTPDSGELIAAYKPFAPYEGHIELDLTVTADSPAGGAFNILDVFGRAAEFVTVTAGLAPPRLTARWKQGSGTGTYYTDSSIYILGIQDDDTDEYDDDVLWHEYGHFVEDFTGALDSPGNVHTLDDLGQDMRLAWSEGWSDFFPVAVKRWLKDTYPDALSHDATISSPGVYIDTVGDLTYISYDFSTAPPLATAEGNEIHLLYTTNEGAVAKVLSDLHLAYGHAPLWSAFTVLGENDHTLSNFESFWDAWNTQPEADPAVDLPILQERGIDYSQDGSDMASDPDDDSFVTATDLDLTGRNFYKGIDEADTDVVPLPVTAGQLYRVETYGLLNGADTFLRILASNGTSVRYDGSGNPLENDNHDEDENPVDYVSESMLQTMNLNDGCSLASHIEFTATSTETLYIAVSPPAQVPLFAGRYGGYSLAVIENPTTAPRCD